MIDPSILSLAIVFGIFYLLMIRPQQKRQRAHARMVAELGFGDDVVTGGGIHGRVVSQPAEDDATVDIAVQVNPRVVLRVQRSAIARVIKDADALVGDATETADAIDVTDAATTEPSVQQ